MTLKISKVDICPKCYRKLCKRQEGNDGMIIAVRHKGLWVWATEAIIRCVQCKHSYYVTGRDGIVEEAQVD